MYLGGYFIQIYISSELFRNYMSQTVTMTQGKTSLYNNIAKTLKIRLATCFFFFPGGYNEQKVDGINQQNCRSSPCKGPPSIPEPWNCFVSLWSSETVRRTLSLAEKEVRRCSRVPVRSVVYPKFLLFQRDNLPLQWGKNVFSLKLMA